MAITTLTGLKFNPYLIEIQAQHDRDSDAL